MADPIITVQLSQESNTLLTELMTALNKTQEQIISDAITLKYYTMKAGR